RPSGSAAGAGRAACLPSTLPARGAGHIHQPGSRGPGRELTGRRMCAATGPGDAGGVHRPAEGAPAMSDLIVIGYPDEHRAHDVWAELVKLQHDDLVDLEDAAIIWRDENGKLRVTTPAHHAVAKGTVSGLFWGTLIGLLFMFPLAPLAGWPPGSWGRRWAPPGASASKTTSGSAS